MSESQTCPRRMGEPGPWERAEGLDRWETGPGQAGLSCSFCGSLNPDRFLELVREGWVVGPTDKPYKVYLESPQSADGQARTHAKVYLQHLSQEQQDEFIDLHNSREMKVGDPGYFYVPPFFTARNT